MALPILDGNQSATTLSTIITGGAHIPAHTVVSLGTQAKSDITSAISGSVVSISNFPSTQTVAGTVTANVPALDDIKSDNGSNNASSAINIGFNTQDNEFKQVSDTQPLPISGTVTVGNSVTIGSLPAISGTVTIGAIGGAVTIPVRLFAEREGTAPTGEDTLLLCNSSGALLVDLRAGGESAIGYDGDAFLQVKQVAGSSVTIGSLPAISGTVTANVQPQQADDNDPNWKFIPIGFATADAYNLVDQWRGVSQNAPLPVSNYGSVTISSLPAISGTVTANSIFPRVTFIDGSGTVATANTAITVFASSSTRSYLLVQVTTGSAFVNVGATATTVNGINLTAGQGYAWENTIPQGIVSLISTTTSSRYVAKEA